MQTVYDKLSADGACSRGLALVLTHKENTLEYFLDDLVKGRLVISEYLTASFSAWIVENYAGKGIFPKSMMNDCIELVVNDTHMSEVKTLMLYRSIRKYLNKKQRKAMQTSFVGRLPRMETPEDCK